MSLKRILNLLLLVTLSLFVLSACSDDSDDSSARTDSTSSGIDWDSILSGSTGTGSGSDSTNTGGEEEEGTEGEGETDSDITDSEDVDTTDTDAEGDSTDTDGEDSSNTDTATDTDADTDTEEVVGSDSEDESDSETEGDVAEVTQGDDEYEFNLLYAKAASYLAFLGLDYCANNTFDNNSYPTASCTSALNNLDISLIENEDYYSEFTATTDKDSDFYKSHFLAALDMYLQAAYKVKEYAETWDTSLLTITDLGSRTLDTNISNAEYHYSLLSKADLARGIWGGSDTSVKHIYNFTYYASSYISQIVYGSISVAAHQSSVPHYAGEVGYYVHRVLKNNNETGDLTSNVSSMISSLEALKAELEEEAATILNNSYTVSELDIVYGELSTSSDNGAETDYYYNANNLALKYNENTNALTVVGKIEIVTSDMTYVSNLALNKLRYRYFNETITVSSLDTLYNEGDDTYTFTFPFELSGDDMIVYSEDSSNKLTFTLTDKADFPSDEESFTATSRSYTSVAYIDSDPYSIQGTYTASSTSCKGLMYYGLISGSQVDGSSQTLTISDIYAKIDENGNLTFTFDVSGFKSGTGYSIPANGSYNVSVDSGTWWGYDSYSLTGSHTYSGYKYNDTITISSTGYAKSLLVEGKSVYNGNSKYYGLIGGGTVDGVNNGKCYFTKQSDYVQ